MARPPVRYTSIDEVPPHLGTTTDYRHQGRTIRDGATPAADVIVRRTPTTDHTRHNQRHYAALYRREDTTPLPNLTPTDLANLQRSRTCPDCHTQHTNPLGKVLDPRWTPCR